MTRKGNTGAYAVMTDSDVFIFSSEIKALREGVRLGGVVKFVEYGTSITRSGENSVPAAPVTEAPEVSPSVEEVAEGDSF